MTIDEQKKSLRRFMLEQRKHLHLDVKTEYDNWICNALEFLISNKSFKVIHAYIPLETEINIYPLLQELLNQKITVVCPKTLPKRKLENRMLTSVSDLEVGIMGTKHPASPTLYNGWYDLILVPGLAFDSKNYRLGYGGGYYDNFLKSQPRAFKVGLFYPFQKVESVPIESHDIALDLILNRPF